MSIDLACPKCRQKYRLKDELAGKKAKCAKCGESIRVPAPAAIAASPAPPAASKPVASNPAAPKPVKPAPPVVRAPVAPIVNKPVAVDPLPDLSDLFDDSFPFAAQPTKVGTMSLAEATSPSNAWCPKCSEPMKESAVVCVKCGYNKKTGKKLTTKHEETSADAKQKKGSAGTLMKGTLFSGIGALIGAGVWAGVGIALDREIGYIAWGLGGAAGVGMAFGHEDDDGTTAGIIASIMAIVGIFAAKVFMFEHFKNSFGDLALEGVEELQGVDEEQLTELTHLITENAALFAEEFTFASMFGPVDAIFILLAVGTAYKLGSGQATS